MQRFQAQRRWQYRVAPAKDNAKQALGGEPTNMWSADDIKKGSGMKKQAFNRGLIVAVWFGLVGCSPSGVVQSEPAWTPQTLLGSQWIEAGLPVGQTPVSLDITPDARISGSTGCNRYMGQAEISGTSVRLTQAASTRMFCHPQEVMETENRFLAALSNTRSAKTEQGLLLLADEAGQVLWRFKPRD
jgi:heat shock protein HslJ